MFKNRRSNNFKIKKLSESRSDNHSSVTISETKEGVVDPQIFRDLHPKQAMAILSIADHSMDDILNLLPAYVN